MIVFLLGLLLAAPATDPGGFLAAKWGMTEDQILAAFPNEAARPAKPEKFNLGPAPVIVARADRKTSFICTPTLQAVIIQFLDDSPAEFLRVEAQLAEQYGRPWHRDSGEIEQSQWTFPTTLIQLRRVALKNIPFRSLSLTYQRRQPSEF
jgi:hypothetical protein